MGSSARRARFPPSGGTQFCGGVKPTAPAPAPALPSAKRSAQEWQGRARSVAKGFVPGPGPGLGTRGGSLGSRRRSAPAARVCLRGTHDSRLRERSPRAAGFCYHRFRCLWKAADTSPPLPARRCRSRRRRCSGAAGSAPEGAGRPQAASPGR